jgi:UPF0755 protein
VSGRRRGGDEFEDERAWPADRQPRGYRRPRDAGVTDRTPPPWRAVPEYGPDEYDPGAGEYGPGAGEYGPGAGEYGPGAGEYGPGRGDYGPDPGGPPGSRRGRHSVPPGPPSMPRDPYSRPGPQDQDVRPPAEYDAPPARYSVHGGAYPAGSSRYPDEPGRRPGPGDGYPPPGDPYPPSGDRYSGPADPYQVPGDQYPPPADRYQGPGGRYPESRDPYYPPAGRYPESPSAPAGRPAYQEPVGHPPGARDRTDEFGAAYPPPRDQRSDPGYPPARGPRPGPNGGYPPPPPPGPAAGRPGSRDEYPAPRDRYPGPEDDYDAPDGYEPADAAMTEDDRPGPYGYSDRGEPRIPGGRDAGDDDDFWNPSGIRAGGWGFGDDADDRPARPKRGRGRFAGLVATLGILAILVPLGIGGFYAYRAISAHFFPADYSGAGTGHITVQIKPGDTATTVGDRLFAMGVVASARAFVNAAEHSQKSSALQPGFYRLHKHMNATQAFNLLLNPSSRIQLKVTIPEGLRESQIVAALGKGSGISPSDYKQALRNTAALGLPSYAHGNPEGYLFPATYTIQPGMSATDVLKAMVKAYDQEAASVNLRQASARGHLTEAEAIVVASLAQAEGGKVSDFPKITRVIYNRLAAGMPLQLDSTVLFALNRYGILATDQQLNVKSPYNTYKHKGLPPGPIDSPGDAAIRAALHPAAGDWLYFVTVNPKTKKTVFTASEAEFNQLRQELQHNLGQGG